MTTGMHERMGERQVRAFLSRGRAARVIGIGVLALVYGFVMRIAFQPKLLGRPVSEGSAVTVGVLFGVFMFVFWVVTAIYVRWESGSLQR